MKDYMYIGFPRIKKFLGLYSALIVILISVAVIFFTIYPLSNRILKFERTRLNSIIRDKKKFIDEYISKYRITAEKIANQPYFRETLLNHLRNTPSLGNLKDILNSKIDEIFYLIPGIKGVLQISLQGMPIFKKGISPPEEFILTSKNRFDNISTSSPFERKGKWYISLFVPLKDEKDYIGATLFTIDFTPVINFLEEGFEDFHYINFALGGLTDKGFQIFFKKGDKKYDSFLKEGIIQGAKEKKVKTISLVRGRKYSQKIVYAPISKTNWVLVLTIDETLLLSPIINTLRLFLFVIILFIISGAIYIYWLFVKIVKGSIERARELEGEVSARSLQLAEEIQKRENLEELYEINMNFLTVVLDTVPIPISARDVERGEYVFVNEAFVKLTKKDLDNIIGKTPHEVWGESIAKKIEDLDDRIIDEKKEVVFEFSIFLDREIYGILTKAPFFDGKGNIAGIVSAFLDLTDKKRLERELSRLARVVEQSSDYIIITDTDGNIVYVNPAFTHITGYKKEEVIGKNPKILKSGRHTKEFYKEFWDTLIRGETWRGEFINRRKNGEEYYDYSVVFPIKDEYDNIISFAAIKRDITEDKFKERRLQQIQKMDTIGRLVGGIAHDFNNLLTVILGYSEFILKKVDKKDPVYKYAEKIGDTGERAKDLTGKLLAFGRRQIYKPQVVDINDEIHEIWNMLKRLVPEDIEVNMTLSPRPLYIYADPVQIEQIIMNLVINAKDALMEKEYKIGTTYKKVVTIETDNIYLDDAYVKLHPGSSVGEFVLISVSDNGIGMDEKTIEKIFEPFFTTKEEGKGTGLGLATIYGIVKQNNATIYVYSEPLEGTTFKIYWPISREKGRDVDGRRGKIKENLEGSETVLIVEDNEDVREFIKESLILLGYKVYEAKNGEDALSLIPSKGLVPDIIVTDVIMPKMNGEELVIRVKEIIPNVKVLFTSGYTYNHITKNGLLKDGIDFIHKPFSMRDLARKIREILGLIS